MVERFIGEREPLALGTNTRATIRGARGEHVSALVQADHLAAIAADQCTGDHACTGCDVEHAVLGLCGDGFDEGARPPRVLAQRQEGGDAFVRHRDAREQAPGMTRACGDHGFA